MSYSQFCRLSDDEVKQIIPWKHPSIESFKQFFDLYKQTLNAPAITSNTRVIERSSMSDITNLTLRSQNENKSIFEKCYAGLDNEKELNFEEAVVAPCTESLANFRTYVSQYSQSK